MRLRSSVVGNLASCLVVLLSASLALAQTPLGTAFTYQGRLTDAGSLATGSYDMRFTLYDALTSGSAVGTPVTVGSVAVSAGLFTATLDFGAAAFSGSKRWLEIGVKPAGSPGSYTGLIPRQELTAVPNSLFSATTGDPAVQRRAVAPACSVGQYVRAIAVDGTPTCAPDTNSGGTVTSVATGAGLTGGTITGSGTVAVATGGITSALIANGAVGAAQIKTSEVQTRLSSVCPKGQALRGVNADGSPVCEVFDPFPQAITAVRNTDIPTPSSLAIGSDGLPVMSFLSGPNLLVMVLKCSDAACSGVNTVTWVGGSSLDRGGGVSLVVGADGLPVMSYQGDEWNGAPQVLKCANAACTGTNTRTTIDTAGAGEYSSIAIGTDGLPIVAYATASPRNQGLKVAKCVNAACTDSSTITLVDNQGVQLGAFTKVLIGNDGFPVISYVDAGAQSLKVVKCANAACTGSSTITKVADLDSSSSASMALGADGFPVLAYVNNGASAGSLEVLKCANAACTGPSTITVLGLGVGISGRAWVAVGADGLPVISYRDDVQSLVKVAKCADPACAAISATVTVGEQDASDILDGNARRRRSPRIGIGADGLPIVVFHKAPGLKVAKCVTATCEP